jgi:hypothetical protein
VKSLDHRVRRRSGVSSLDRRARHQSDVKSLGRRARRPSDEKSVARQARHQSGVSSLDRPARHQSDVSSLDRPARHQSDVKSLAGKSPVVQPVRPSVENDRIAYPDPSAVAPNRTRGEYKPLCWCRNLNNVLRVFSKLTVSVG